MNLINLIMISCLDSQTYALLYCQYDPESGHRNWRELINNKQVETVDFIVARNGVKANENNAEIQKIIYFGSPQSQLIKDIDERLDYSFRITALALLPNLLNHQQRELLLFSLSFLKTHLDEDILSQIVEASPTPTNSNQIVSLLNQIVELINL
ncbi:MAG: hypothetical protein AAGF26_13470 [Cyanobacteria bacterium P01_G01_bin.49]